MNRNIRRAAAAALLLCGAAQVGATTISVVSSKDNTLYEDVYGALSNGAGAGFFVGVNNHGQRSRGLVAFDLGVIPAGATINSVSLSLNLSRSVSGSGGISLHRSTANWGEGESNATTGGGGGGAPATAGDATWLHTFYDTGVWTSAGGDYASASASGNVSFGTNTIGSTSQLVADVQGWLTNPASNFGWFVIGDESGPGTAMRFDTRENTFANTQPRLTIEFSLGAGSSYWSLAGDGAWDDPGNWAGGVPNSSGARATFNTLGGAHTISLASPQTVGTLSFASTPRYTIAGGGTLNISSSGASLIEVSAGSHTIAALVHFSNDATISVATLSVLDLTGAMSSDASVSLTKTGAGTLNVRQIRATNLTISQGRVRVLANGSPAGRSRLQTLTMSAGSSIDLADNDLILDAATAGQVRAMLIDGRIQSTLSDATHRLGYAGSAVLGLTEYEGEALDPASVIVKYTFNGDSNLDGQVDLRDLYLLAANFNTTSGAWAHGDYNYDGRSDAADLGLLSVNWQAGVTAPLSLSLEAALAMTGLAGASVPEPTALGMVGLAAFLVRRRTCRNA